MRGSVMDLAASVIIAVAFGTIVSSLTDDAIMPVMGAIFGSLDFTYYFAPLSQGVMATTLDAAREQGAVLAYGSFTTAVVNFVILGFIIFLMVKAVNSMMKKEEKKLCLPDRPRTRSF
jgi:large conductance mechanosensitive channel